MLFNSYIFLFVFLPVVVIVYYQLGGREKRDCALTWLVFSSLVFYGWWNPSYLALILSSIGFNFGIGKALRSSSTNGSNKGSCGLLVLGITVNLAAIAYFKYANFFVENANAILGTQYHLSKIVLPLAISFFTFQQITYLVDAYKGEVRETNFLRYCLFVTFFPQLIAGPIVHHREMLPQFASPRVFGFQNKYLAIGATIFALGLFKKVVIADGIAVYSTPLFDAALTGFQPTFFEAWGAALAYTFQLYFDFSGYSDMAVGLAYLFGIRLALNFFSPYKAVNIIDFWRRWHISLSRFLRDYVYISLGGNRMGTLRRYQNLLITMLLGGLWHGAGWTFVLWGALHGFYLVLNNVWRYTRSRLWPGIERTNAWGRWVARTLTFIAVVIGWVIFRAESLPAAASILHGMAGLNGFALPPTYLGYLNYLLDLGTWFSDLGWNFSSSHLYFGGRQPIFLVLLLFCVWFMPNTYQIMGKYSPAQDISAGHSLQLDEGYGVWRPGILSAAITFALLLVVLFRLDGTSEFLYFQF